jgi:hypothetical protein
MVSLVISNLSSPFPFSEYTKTRQVGRFGCLVRTTRPLSVGTQVRLDILNDATSRTTSARVIHSEPLQPHQGIKQWTSGLALDNPGNIWWGMAGPSEAGMAVVHAQSKRGPSSSPQPVKPLHPLDRAVLYALPAAAPPWPASETRRHDTPRQARPDLPARSWTRPQRSDNPRLRLLRFSNEGSAAEQEEPGQGRWAADRSEQPGEQAGTPLRSHRAVMESCLDTVTAELDTGFPARVQRVVAEAVARLREHLEHRLNDLIHEALMAERRPGVGPSAPAAEQPRNAGLARRDEEQAEGKAEQVAAGESRIPHV